MDEQTNTDVNTSNTGANNMKASSIKAAFTKSANALNEHAVATISTDDSVTESVAKRYATIIAQLRSMSTMSEAQLSYAESIDYKAQQISELSKAESREFYKRLRSVLSAATSSSFRDNPLSSFLMDISINGKQDAYTYGQLRSMFGHDTNTQAGYFARALRLLGVAEIDASARGNQQNGYKLIPDWNSKLLSDLTS